MAPVITDGKFPNANSGLVPQLRNLSSGGFKLRIMNLDRADPPQYTPAQYSRAETFNKNMFSISATPKMPKIQVVCNVEGGDLSASPLIWRLQTLYVVGRYEKINHSDTNPEYKSLLDTHGDEWTGEAHDETFTLFDDDYNVTYDNLSARVSGGDCLLTVAWNPSGTDVWLQDFVHIRIGGTNPTESDVRAYNKIALADRDTNFLSAANAVFAWEADFKQFDLKYRTQEKFHGVLFTWPSDPANFPLVAFDFGIGLCQYTHWGQESNAICWDWRENLNSGINELLSDFRAAYRKGSPWIAWAKRAWGRYNGGDSGGTGSYATARERSADGKLISSKPVPAGFDVTRQTQPIAMMGNVPKPRHWPVIVQPRTVLATVGANTMLAAKLASFASLLDDSEKIPKLIELGSDPKSIAEILEFAKDDMQKLGKPRNLHNACAATLCEFMRATGIDVPVIYSAAKLAEHLHTKRHWQRIEKGQQEAGDVGVTEDRVPPAGADHIYLVVKVINGDEVSIADNQAPRPHERSVSGKDTKTPTDYFLRAPSHKSIAGIVTAQLTADGGTAAGESDFPEGDEETNNLPEPNIT